ncbi:MAG: hydrogenase maturation protease [Halanaeroarchaeum sp.]
MTEQAVVGVGNQIMRDDGLSAAVVDALRDAGLDDHPNVSLSHAGTTAFFALEAMDGADRAIVVDAIQVPDADPGDVHRIVYREGAFETADFDINMHDFSFTEALAAGDHAYDVPDEIVVLGMTPAVVTAGLELSATVREGLDELVALVRRELERGGTTIDAPKTTAEGSP